MINNKSLKFLNDLLSEMSINFNLKLLLTLSTNLDIQSLNISLVFKVKLLEIVCYYPVLFLYQIVPNFDYYYFYKL